VTVAASRLHVAVVGAGIGGLTLALALLDAGCEVTVLEQAPELTEVGAGVQLAPNATRVLGRLRVLDRLRPLAHMPERGSFRRWDDGRLLSTQVLGEQVEREFGAPYLQFHRGDLVIGLASAVPTGVLQLGRRVAAVDQGHAGVVVRTDDGGEVRADVGIAADGIHSSLRKQLFGADDVEFSGAAAYRGVVAAEAVADLGLEPYSVWLGPGRHFVQYYVRNGELLNFVGIVDSDWKEQSYTTQVTTLEAVEEYAEWDPKVPAILRAAPSAFLWALNIRKPLQEWHLGRVALLGDSAPAMVPFLAQGAAQAILDAAVLARCLAGVPADGVEEALARYAAIRHEASLAVQQAALATGKLYNAPDGPIQEERDRTFAELQESEPYSPQARFWSYDPWEVVA
jgi:salicylate hydroxylase